MNPGKMNPMQYPFKVYTGLARRRARRFAEDEAGLETGLFCRLGCIKRKLFAAVVAAALSPMLQAEISPMTPDIIDYQPVRESADYVRREVMIPMRDGAKLYTVIVMPKGTQDGPILLSRTPYNAGAVTWRIPSQRIDDILPVADREFIRAGYIRVYQDVRGLYGSEGDYVMTRPARGPLNNTGIDHSTDAYDTIEWLLANVPESSDRIGIVGASYLGFTSLMALIEPHPALRAVVAMSPMVDGWIGDDWFHNGAFRQSSFAYVLYQMDVSTGGVIPFGGLDHYDVYLQAGSAADFARKYGLDAFPAIRKMMAHPAYDGFWQHQAVDRILQKHGLTRPTMLVIGQWDQEDSYGAPAVYRALEPYDTNNDKLSFVIGPWRHSGMLHDGRRLGQLTFEGDTALQFRRDTMKPFLDRHLLDKTDARPPSPVLTYATGINRWHRSESWPAGDRRPLYFAADFTLLWSKPGAGSVSYTSDPGRPVPFMPRPIDMSDADRWRTWRLSDQRFVQGRPDVLTYMSSPLGAPMRIAGAPKVDLWASTSGTDSDWVVKLIDAAPDGSQSMIGIEIFRGRYVDSFESPRALRAHQPEKYSFELPNVDHVFRRGHRLVVQVQSSLFPLYDRNPQTYSPNIFFAEPDDYRRATQTVFHGSTKPSSIWLPIVSE